MHISAIEQAAQRIAPYVPRTPVLQSETLNKQYECTLHFKCENLQPVGAFKARGATNAVMLLSEEQGARGVITHSSGNHAQALAWAAARRGIPCTVVMPNTSPAVKVNGTRKYGAVIEMCENTLEARERMLNIIVQESGSTLIHPYDNDHVIAGQGTVALEFLQQVPELDFIVVPVGGGGLISGIALASRHLKPQLTIIGAEPELAADAKRALETGVVQPPFPPVTIADGLRTALCDRTLQYMQQTGVSIATASEREIYRATITLIRELRVVVEPSGAVGLACLESVSSAIRGKHVGVIISGGNVDLANLFSDEADTL